MEDAIFGIYNEHVYNALRHKDNTQLLRTLYEKSKIHPEDRPVAHWTRFERDLKSCLSLLSEIFGNSEDYGESLKLAEQVNICRKGGS